MYSYLPRGPVFNENIPEKLLEAVILWDNSKL